MRKCLAAKGMPYQVYDQNGVEVRPFCKICPENTTKLFRRLSCIKCPQNSVFDEET